MAAAYTEKQLRELADRIEADAEAGDGFLDGYGHAGFYVPSARVDDDTGTVQVSVYAARPDAAAYFAGRYGPAVDVVVAGDRFECPQ